MSQLKQANSINLHKSAHRWTLSHSSNMPPIVLSHLLIRKWMQGVTVCIILRLLTFSFIRHTCALCPFGSGFTHSTFFTQRLSVWRRAELTSCSTHTKDSFSPQVLELHELESAAGVSPNPGPGTTHRSLSGFQLKHTVEFAVSPPKKGIWTPGLGQMHVSVSVYWGKPLNSVGLQISWKKMWGRLTSGLQTQKCCGKKNFESMNKTYVIAGVRRYL